MTYAKDAGSKVIGPPAGASLAPITVVFWKEGAISLAPVAIELAIKTLPP